MTTEKATELFLAELPAPIGAWAAEQLSKDFGSFDISTDEKVHEVLYNSFSWDQSPQGYRFWDGVYEALKNKTGEFPLGGFDIPWWDVVVWPDRVMIGCQRIKEEHLEAAREWLKNPSEELILTLDEGYSVVLAKGWSCTVRFDYMGGFCEERSLTIAELTELLERIDKIRKTK